jgi:DNA (cytosine-5)-methyltransferase 1
MAIRVVDFFSGCGGTSAGLQAAGLAVVAAIDVDAEALASFALNFPNANCIHSDIAKVETTDLEALLGPNDRPLLFSACAPCTPFSKQRRGRESEDERVQLLWQFVRFVRQYLPDFVFVENVPGLQTLADQMGPYNAFIPELEGLGYSVEARVLESRAYGIPQLRRRLVVVASRVGEVGFPLPSHGPGTATPQYSTAREWIGDLPPVSAGESDPVVPNHRAAGLSPMNLSRIRATPEGGGREHWPPDLIAPCHRGGYSGHRDSYGRMKMDAPATGLTTRCISYSNGRFGHPHQDRAITVREAACLQTFPRDFIFAGTLNSMARQVGNAVPVLLAQRFGEHFNQLWETRGASRPLPAQADFAAASLP